MRGNSAGLSSMVSKRSCPPPGQVVLGRSNPRPVEALRAATGSNAGSPRRSVTAPSSPITSKALAKCHTQNASVVIQRVVPEPSRGIIAIRVPRSTAPIAASAHRRDRTGLGQMNSTMNRAVITKSWIM